MDVSRRALIGAGIGIGLLAARSAQAQDWGAPSLVTADPELPPWPPQERHRLWPKAPPGVPAQLPTPSWMMFGEQGRKQLWIKGIAEPEINVFRPAKPNGSALLCCPGGGYEFLSVQNEGSEVAHYFNGHGMTVFVLTYRLPAEGWANRQLVPLQDAQRAVRLIRSRADFFDVDPKRVGVIGFSAGGHLAADLTTSSALRTYEPVDAADELSARPDFAGLVYPVATLDRSITHPGSRNNLVGAKGPPIVRAERSPLHNVSAETPPCILAHAIDDGLVPPENSIAFTAACRKAKVPVETHLFGEGGHGFGMRLPPDMPGSRWPELFALWMRKHGA